MISLPVTVPRVVSVIADGNGITYTVTFDQAVTWDGLNTGTFDFPDGNGSWINQVTPTSLRIVPQSGVSAPGVGWDWTGPDPSLHPTPDDTQTGVTS